MAPAEVSAGYPQALNVGQTLSAFAAEAAVVVFGTAITVTRRLTRSASIVGI
jgi:hypothetical protein